jgi:hypothetical protein
MLFISVLTSSLGCRLLTPDGLSIGLDSGFSEPLPLYRMIWSGCLPSCLLLGLGDSLRSLEMLGRRIVGQLA